MEMCLLKRSKLQKQVQVREAGCSCSAYTVGVFTAMPVHVSVGDCSCFEELQ